MKLIVGLGNPGKEYEKTRHNIGFIFVDNYVNTNNLGSYKEKFNGLFLDTNIGTERIIFLKPLTYMNLSGECIKKFVDYFNINLEDILIICDDLDMTVGRIKLKKKGSTGGHNGLKSIESVLSSSDYKRIKIGIGNNKSINTRDYVLGKFSKEEMLIIENEMKIVNDILDDYLKMSFDNLMNKYNGKEKGVQND